MLLQVESLRGSVNFHDDRKVMVGANTLHWPLMDDGVGIGINNTILRFGVLYEGDESDEYEPCFSLYFRGRTIPGYTERSDDKDLDSIV